ncbi:LOW QUALITY PROTEIN: fibrous sheath-interacting protein 2 isoform X1 [Canis lupus familiaris]|uniref:LOW QUALITY PROTEIN: fibrous sheath-interacting protein 2 isoform X1 n=1 Tax=Canis lupus familiaris TaxID=9615 RepID=UPI0018F7D667|nr:LOW QUALITY PROTEIN: fibrous sheath-interacting protein 2 isoform X1 [Canis lupus familiaris]
MELYLSACSKAASDAATKTASSSLAADSQRCGDGVHKTHIRGVGAGQLLDLPLGVKLPVIPGSNTLYYTTKISEKLFRPSYGFNLNDPYCRLLENQYKSLHDPHLREYYKRKDILRRLKKGGYITSNNKIVCTLRELNKYRQYLTSIKLDFERNYIRDQEMLAKQVNRLHENNQIPGRSDVAQFQNWLLQEGTQSMKDQEQLIRHRYLDMISRELEQLERTAEEQRLLQMDREERRQREYTRRKLSLRRKIEEEWKTKEMLLLTRIGEDVRREARIEEQRRRSREESDRKKQALIEKKMAYHLQKMQENGFKGEDMRNDTFHYRGQDGRYCEPYSLKKKKKIYDNMNLVYPVGDQRANKAVNGPTANVIYQCLSTSKTVNKKTANPAGLSDVQVNDTGQKKEKITQKSSNFDDRGNVHISAQNSVVSPQTSPTRNCPKSSPSYLDPPKDEKGITADCNGRLNKSSSYLCESGPPVHATAQGTFPSRVFSNIDQSLLENCLQEKVTSEELNSIIQNIMTWVVATVTSILYPAITKYEERLRNKAYPVSEDSILSSDSSSFCSTCSEEFTYGSYTSATTQTFHREPCAFAVDISVRRPTTPLKPPSAHVERTIVGKTYDVEGQSITSELKYNKTSMIYAYPKVRTCKSDSHLLTSFERCTKISKDATTETDGLESPLFPDQKAKATNEMKNLKNVFVNFKCHLKGETELILESIFQEIMSDLTQAIPSLSSVTAEVFVDQSEPEKEDLLSNIDICSAASEIVENMLEKLQSAVEKKCVEIFSPEDLSVDIKPGLPLSREYLSPSNAKSLKASLPYNLEPMCDIAEDMVHAILEKLMALASCKQNELPRLEDTTRLSDQQPMTDPTCTSLKRASKKKPSPEPDAATLMVKDQIQDLISNIFSQSSLVGYIEEAISTILGFVQTELNNERLIASEETIVVLQLLDDAFTQLHQEPVKADAPKCRHSRLQNPSDTEEKYRLTGTRLSNGPRSKRSFPPINVPGMVLYSEDDNEEIDKIVKNVLDSSFRDEKPKSQAQIPENQFTKGNTCFEYKKNSKPPTKAASGRSKVEFCERGLKTELPSFNDKEILKEKPCLNRDMLIFSQDEKHHIQKASENIVKSILTEMLKDLASVPGHLDSKIGQEASVLVSEKSQGLSHQERTDQMISVSEISAVAQEITDAVLNILQKASRCILNTTKGSISSSVQTSLGSSDTPHTVEGAPNKKPLKIWFDSEKKVKYLSSVNVDSAKPSPLKSEKSEPQPVGDVTDKIINTICKRLKLFICQKLQMGFKPSVVEQTSLKSQLSGYTTKVVNIVLRAIQNELELNKRSLNHRELDPAKSLTGKGLLAGTDKLESLVSNLSDDIMESPLLTCIYEMLSSGHCDQSSISLPAEKPKPATSYGSDIIDKQDVLPSRQDQKSFHRFLATPCALHSVVNGKDPKDNARLQVLDSIGEALYEMLCTLIATHSQHQPPCSKPNGEKNENSQMAATLKSNIQHISKTILEYILAKLCSVDTDTSFASSGFKAVSESLDIDNLSFASIIEEMAKCTDIISGIISRMIQEGPKQVTKSKAKTITPASSKTGSTKETPPNELKAIALDILNMVFAKLEGFANGNLETLGSLNDGNEESGKRALEWESPSIFTDTHEELLQSALYTNAKRISSTILKAIQMELNVNSLDLKTSVNTPTPEKQMLKNIVNLILDAVSSDMFNETESEEGGTETYRYRPTYGNSLPGGAESDSFLEDASCTKKEFTGERTLVREEDKSDSLKQWVLERTLSKIQVKLKDPQKSPIVPIIRNILNEIFQNALVSQLNVLSLSHCHLRSTAHDVDEPIPQTSVQFIDKMMGPIVSEADVIIVADDVVRTVFHKLFSAAMLERNASENRYKTITFRANVSLHEHTHGGKSSVSVLDKNPCTLTSRLNDDKQAKVNIVEDIVQAILTNLETFATSKVRSLFCPQINFTVPMAFPTQDKSALSKALSAKDLYSGDQLSTCSVDHITSEETNSVCQLPLNKLNTYATEVARKILQGIKHELDKERESPFLTHNIVVSESVASHVVNTVLDIVSSKGKCGKNNSEEESNSGQQEGIIEKLFNKTEYRKVLQFQIQDIIEGILCDIYEKTLYQNHLSCATATLKCSTAGKHSGANSETVTEEANKIIPRLSVPKSDVILVSNDMVNIVLHNLSSAVLLSINAKNPTSARLPLNFCDIFSQAECQQPPLMGSTNERKTEYLPPSGSLKSTYADDCQITAVEKEDAKKSAPDPSEENANFITKTVFNRLEAFATERIDSLITVAFQANEESIAGLELENYKRDDSACHESSQTESNVNVLKVSTKTILGLELTDSTFASYRENLRSTIHLPQGCLKKYADIITSAILRLIKSDLDLEIQKMYSYPNNISFQENILVSGIVNSILENLYDKRSAKEISVYSKDNPKSFSPLTVPNEIWLGQREQEKDKLPRVSIYPLEQNQMTLEKESQGTVLEEIFMRNGESKQKEKTVLLSAVEDVLTQVHQRIMEIIGHLSPFNEIPHLVSNSKIRTSGITQKNLFQSQISSTANDVVESVFGKMYSIVVISLNKSNRQVGAPDNNDTLSKKVACAKETKQTGKGSNATRYVIPQVYSYADSQNVSLLENKCLQYSPSQVGKDLVQMVLNKIINFASIHLEETLSPESCSDELQPVKLHSSKVSFKGSPKPDFKTGLKARPKVTPLSKFRTKSHLGPGGTKVKGKTRLGAREKTPRDSQSKTSTKLSHSLSAGDAKNLLDMKLPTSELKMYAKDIISTILETIMKAFEKVKQTRTMMNVEALPSDQIMAANETVTMVLQELYATSNHDLAYPIKFSHVDHLKLSQGHLDAEYLAKPQACFYLENVSSQLEQIFPKEGIFKKMFDKWQAESNDMENEKYKLMMIAENVLTEIPIKAKELEHSLSLLSLPQLEDCESRCYSHFKGTSTRLEDTKAQINIFGREIVEMLFEKLQLCFLSQVSPPDSKETLASRKEYSRTRSKHDLPIKDILSSAPVYNTKTIDQISLGSSNQIVRDIVERVLNILESFVDLQFKYISKYEFSEIVKMPIENFFRAQQSLLSKKMLPKLQPLKKFSDEPSSSTIASKENIQATLLQLHSFHSELLTYAINIVSDMLSTIKNKLDKEISQVEPSSISTLKETVIASEIIGTLMDQCTHINNLPKERWYQGAENSYVANQVELATNMKMPTSKLKEVRFGDNPLQIIPGVVCHSEENMKRKYRASSNLPSYARASIEDTIKGSEPMERLDSENTVSCFKNKVQDYSARDSDFGHFDQTVRGSSSLPEASVLQRLFKKANESTETALKQVMSFIEIGKGENPRVFHYETLKPVEPNQIQTNVSPLKICLAAENIVNTVLSSSGFPSQPHINEKNMETMKPIFISNQNPLSVISEGQKNEEKSLLRTWDKKVSYLPEEEEKRAEASWGDFSLLQKWESQRYPRRKSLKEVKVIAFADHELGSKEIHLVARHITTSVVTYFKNFETRASSEEKVSVISTLSSKKCESEQPLRSIYTDSSLNQFCDHLTESVICRLTSSISGNIKDSRAKGKTLESQIASFNKIISIDSQMFESRSISIGELALSISNTITEILLKSNVIEVDTAQQMLPLETKYVYCPGVAPDDFDNLFQDLLTGVIHVMSKEIGINHHLESNGRKSFSMLRRNRVTVCNETNTLERQKGSKDWESSNYQIDPLLQKSKLNYLARKLDNLAGTLKTHESKEVVNKVFNIVLDLFLPDEHPDDVMNSGKTAGTFYSSSNDQQSNGILENNLGLTPKSVFLLNVVCEKLIRTLLEKCTNTVSLDNSPLSNEISAEEYKLLKTLQNVDEESDYYKGAMDCEQIQDYMSDFLENLAEIDQDLLSSDSMLTIISHNLVKSLMEKLHHSVQLPQTPPFACTRREMQASFIKATRPELTELGQGKAFLGFMSYDSNALTDSLNNPTAVSSKIEAPLGKKCSINSTFVSPLKRQGSNDMETIPIHNKPYPGDINTGVYSATFLEEIISELFFNLSTSLWGKNEITEGRLNEMNTLFVNNIVKEFNKAQVTALRKVEERLCFPPIHEETISRIVGSVYCDVFQQYKLRVTCDDNLACDNTSLAEQITNGILLEILDYQLPSCFRGKLAPNSYYPLQAEIILQKLHNKLRKFTSSFSSSTGYSTMLSHSFLEDIIRRLLSQLIPLPNKASSLGNKYFMSADFNEMSTCIINKVISAISKHKILFTIYDNQYLCTGKNLQKMVDSVYSNIMQMSDSLVSIQKSIVSRSPIMINRIASFIIQEIIDNHLQPFLCGEGLPRPKIPLDAVSNMVKQVLNEVTESHRLQTPSPLGIYPDTFVGEIVSRLLSRIFSPKHNTEIELENMTQKIVNSINSHFNKAKIHFLNDDKEQPYTSINTDIVDQLVTSIYRNVLKQHGLDSEVDKESEGSDIFVENITNLIVAAISDYLLHPLFSGDLSSSSHSIPMAENIVQDILSNISKSTKSSQSLSPYNTLLPYTFLDDMIRGLLSRIFPSASSSILDRKAPKDRSRVNFNEIASKIISDIRMKISQHEIRFSKNEETKFVYSEDDVQNLVDSVFKNISQNSESQEPVEQNITGSNDILIDRIAGFIIKHICHQHLQPFVDGKLSPPSSYTYFDDERKQWFYATVYSSAFLEDVVSGVLSKIFHRVLGIVQTKSVRDSEDELFDKAEKLIHLIAEEFPKFEVSILENAEEQLCLPPVERDVVKNIIDTVYSKLLQEYEMGIMPDEDFLNDTKTLATRMTKIILAETFNFQIHPNLIGKLPFTSHSKLNTNVLMKRVQCYITKSRFQRQASTVYTTMLSHTHLEKIVTQLLSQMSQLATRTERPDTSQSDLSNTVIKLINEIMSIISKHAICIVKHGQGKQSMISEKDIQSMVDSIYADLSYSNLYQSLTKDKKGISNIPVSKIASFIIKEIFNHHLQSFLSADKTLLLPAVDQTRKQKAIDPKQRELSFIVNSAFFLEEVISELLCKLLYAFSHNLLAAENPDTVKAKITGIVTTLVNSIVLEFTTSEILVADNFDADMCFSEGYREIVQKTVNLIYEKILDEYKSLIQVYRALQSDTVCFGRKIYHLLLEEIYDYQVQSLVSGELVPSSFSSPQADNIIRNVLNVITNDSHTLPSCVTVLPRSLLEDMIYKLLVHVFPSSNGDSELKEEEVASDCEFVDATSKLTEEIIKEISAHEVRLAAAEEHAESMQLEVIENLVDSICNNILKKSEFQAEVQKGADKKGGSFLSKIAGFIMKEIMDHHLQPFLHGEESSSRAISDHGRMSVLSKPGKEKTQPALYSATFLEDVIVDLVHKFYSLPSITEDSKKKEVLEPDIVGLAIKFANSLIGEFRKSKIKVLPKAEEMFSFPPIDKETVDKISNFVYDQFMGKYRSSDIQTDDKSNIVIETIAALAQKAISAFKIQPLFSGDWSATFFSFLNPDNITQRVQHLPQQTSTQINRSLKGNELALPKQSHKHTSVTTDQKNVSDTLETDSGAIARKKSLKTEKTSMKKGDVQDTVVNSITRIMGSNVINVLSMPAASAANKKKGTENKTEVPGNENVSGVASLTTSVKSKARPEPDLVATLESNEIEKTSISATKDEKRQDNKVHMQSPVATMIVYEGEKLGPNVEIKNEEIDKISVDTFKKEDKPFQLSVTSKARNTRTKPEGGLKTVTQRPNNEDGKDPAYQKDVNEEQYSDYEYVQNVTENIYNNILELYHSAESAEYSKPPSLVTDATSHVIQDVGQNFTQSVSTRDSSFSMVKEKEDKDQQRNKEREKEREREKWKKIEKVKSKEIKSEPSKSDSPHYPPKSKPGIVPAKFLEDVITEMVNKLIFSSSSETQICNRYQNVSDDENQAELYDTALKLMDSLLKEFSDAQIKVFRPHEENQFFPPADKVSSVPKAPPRHKKPTAEETSSNIKKMTGDKMPHMPKMLKNPSSNKIPFLDKIQVIDKTLVNKVVHSSVCNILKEYKSQDSICKDIKSNGENLARRLTRAVINEIFQHQLNFIFCDEVLASACSPLESKDVVRKVQKVAQTASKECQTSSPYTIMLPHKFLGNVISALLWKIFSTVSDAGVETSEYNWFTKLDFLQMKLLNTVTTAISKDKDMTIQYVESLHPNDDEIIQLVIHSIYNNLLSQFGSQEVIQNCVASRCRILSETIVDLVLQEVSGNQLQNYFSGELTPHQCTEVDKVVENILKDVIQTADVPQPQPSRVHILPYNIVEEITVKFLSKLLSMFPNVDEERTKSQETDMQTISSKILNSIQEFMSKSMIKLVPPAKELPTVPLANNETIEKVVNSVYASVLKHSGSHTSVFKDLMGNSNVLSDVIGLLMVKEISNSEFQPPVEDKVSSSELVLEAVKIIEKVLRIVDEFKSGEKSSSKKHPMLDARLVEEALALFLAKIVRLQSISCKDAKNVSKPELNKIVSQLMKSVTAEISQSNINLVAADPEYLLNSESIEMISQVIDSVYSNVLQQSGTQEELYDDLKGTNTVFPKKVASLIINGVSHLPVDAVSGKNPNAKRFGNLDVNRIIQKAQKHAAIDIMHELQEDESYQDSTENFPIRIVPHIGNKAINIDPEIISDHLAVISVKTEPLEKLKMECLRKTGHSITELRRASISGRSYSLPDTSKVEKIKRERRISLNRMGRLDVKPLEAVCRNSFQNIRKPDITKVELLKDVQNKKDLIIRLVAHDIYQEDSVNATEEGLMSEGEVVLKEVTQEGSLEQFEDQVKEATKPVESTSSLKKFLSLSKCCQSTSSVNIECIEATSNHIIEPKARKVKRTIAELDMAMCSRNMTETGSWEKKPQSKKEDKTLNNEPTHYFIHRIMSSSSYNQEDLISSASETEDFTTDSRDKLLEGNSQEQRPENSNSLKFITIFEGNKNIHGSGYSSKEVISETAKPSISKQGSKMLAKVSSALSKVFSRTNTNISKPSSSSHQDEHESFQS